MTSTFTLLSLIAASLFIDEILCGIAPTSYTDTKEYFVTSDRPGTFEGAAIECSKSACYVTCDETEGCVGVTINAAQADNLFVSCSGSNSCQQAAITSGASQYTQIDCTASAACQFASFDVGLSTSVSITCAYPSASSLLDAPCSFATFQAQDSTSLVASCAEDYACYYTNIWCPSSSPLPADAQCTIECDDGGITSDFTCANLNVYIGNALEAEHVTVACPSFAALACWKAEFKCVNDEDSRYPSTELVYAWRSLSQYDCAEGACCPIPYKAGVIDCSDQTQNCVIDCTTRDCSNYVIDGSQVTSSLTVNCNDDNGGCSFADIKCPTSLACNVNCLNANACGKVSISAADAQSLDLSCEGAQSCSSSTVFCPAHSVDACNIACAEASNEVCADMYIYSDIKYVVDFLALDCGTTQTADECNSIRSYCTNYGGVSGSKQYTELLYDNSNTQWQCQNTTLSCCPWQSTGIKPDPVSDAGTNGDGVLGIITSGTLPTGLMAFLITFASIACCILCAINGHCSSKRKVKFVDPNFHGGNRMYAQQGSGPVQVVHVHHHHQQPAPTVLMVQPKHVSVPSAPLSEAPPSYAQAGRDNAEGQVTNV